MRDGAEPPRGGCEVIIEWLRQWHANRRGARPILSQTGSDKSNGTVNAH